MTAEAYLKIWNFYQILTPISFPLNMIRYVFGNIREKKKKKN